MKKLLHNIIGKIPTPDTKDGKDKKNGEAKPPSEDDELLSKLQMQPANLQNLKILPAMVPTNRDLEYTIQQ